MRHEIGIGDQHARRVPVRFKDGDRFAGLHQQRFIIFEILEGLENRIETFPIACGLPASSIDDEVLWAFRHFGIEIVLDHAVGGFGEPRFAGELRTARRADYSGTRHGLSPHDLVCRLRVFARFDMKEKFLPAIIVYAGRNRTTITTSN